MIVTKRPIAFRIVVIPQRAKNKPTNKKTKQSLDQEQWFRVDRLKLSPGLLERAATRVAKRRSHLAGIQDISESTCHQAAVGRRLSEFNALFGVIWRDYGCL